MRMLKRSIFTVSLFLLCLSVSRPMEAEDQEWMTNSLTINVTSRGCITFSNEFRFRNIFFKERYLHNWQIGFNYRIFKSFYLGAAYKREIDQKLQYNLKEDRFILEIGWRKRLSRSIDFQCRFNAELRLFAEHMAQDHIRARLRLLLVTKLKIFQVKTIPFIGIEPFFDSVTKEINENRSYAGLLFPAGKHFRLEVGYIRQDKKNWETVHILNTGLHLVF
jgi:hypothetical protein